MHRMGPSSQGVAAPARAGPCLPPPPAAGADPGAHPFPSQLKSFHNELLTQLEQKVELDARYLSVSSPAPRL